MSTQLNQLTWLEPWEPTASGLEYELERELGREHLLFGYEAESLARRKHSDEVLFALKNHPSPLAVVHLTWEGQPEANPDFPWTEFYASLDDWRERCMLRDHQDRLVGY